MTELQALINEVEAYAQRSKGKMYAPIDHEAFSHIPYAHGHERFEAIQANMPAGMKTALDIGSHWGYFAHRLEQLGLTVTAVEMSPTYLNFLNRIRALHKDTFTVYPKSIFSMEGDIRFDVILGLNIFHHFIKKETDYQQFRQFLSRVQCKAMFFQAHSPEEGQMKDAYKNFSADEFCQFLIENVPGFSSAKRIATIGARPMFIIQ